MVFKTDNYKGITIYENQKFNKKKSKILVIKGTSLKVKGLTLKIYKNIVSVVYI